MQPLPEASTHDATFLTGCRVRAFLLSTRHITHAFERDFAIQTPSWLIHGRLDPESRRSQFLAESGRRPIQSKAMQSNSIQPNLLQKKAERGITPLRIPNARVHPMACIRPSMLTGHPVRQRSLRSLGCRVLQTLDRPWPFTSLSMSVAKVVPILAMACIHAMAMQSKGALREVLADE
jgi:hypothetical protein